MGRPRAVTCATSRAFEGEQWSHQPPPPARGNPREARRRAPLQEPEENRFDLVVPMVRGHQVARAVTSLDLAEPRIPRPSGDGLRSVGAEAQLADLERQLVALRQLAD